MLRIPFNRPFLAGRELDQISLACRQGHLGGDGAFSRKCVEWIQRTTGALRALLTPSGTAALEMAAMLIDTAPGDEIIMPSFTFPSTANAFVLRGAVPVFVDIRSDTLNINEHEIEAAITSRTKAIVVVHYGGVACEMDAITEIAQRHGLIVIEDAAHGIGSFFRGRPLGSFGDLAALSFHETKNVISGEGGALLINREVLIPRAEVIREKGTDRSRFLRGEVDRYTWVDLGSSYLTGEITAAFLWAQFEAFDQITERRRAIWNHYYSSLAGAELEKACLRPRIPPHCQSNGHLFYLLLHSPAAQALFMDSLGARGIDTASHYVPLHSSPAGIRFGRRSGSMEITDSLSSRLVRLPVWVGIEKHLPRVIDEVAGSLRKGRFAAP